MLTISQELLVPVICNPCNASLQSGVFPTSLKQAILLPRLKKSTPDPCSLASHRPISNLTLISKVVERTVTSRLVGHAEENKLFPVKQSSYRRSHSTETAILQCVHNDLVRAVDNKQVTALVLLHLSSAFDTVDHAALLNVLIGVLVFKGL